MSWRRCIEKIRKLLKKAFSQAWDQNPDSQVLGAWYERLHFKEKVNKEKTSLFQKGFLFMGLLAILAGISTRIIFHFVEQEAIAPINLAFGVIPFIVAYFVYNNTPKKKYYLFPCDVVPNCWVVS